MQMLIRPYNADGPRLRSAIKDGAPIDGIVIDAHIGSNHGEARRSNRGERDSCAARRRREPSSCYSTSWSERRDLPAMRMSRPLWTRRSAMAEAAALL